MRLITNTVTYSFKTANKAAYYAENHNFELIFSLTVKIATLKSVNRFLISLILSTFGRIIFRSYSRCTLQSFCSECFCFLQEHHDKTKRISTAIGAKKT